MSDALKELQHAAVIIREWHINPWLATVTVGLLFAWMEQRRAARRAPPFTTDHTGAKISHTR
jgi:hypothetical protein